MPEAGSENSIAALVSHRQDKMNCGRRDDQRTEDRQPVAHAIVVDKTPWVKIDF